MSNSVVMFPAAPPPGHAIVEEQDAVRTQRLGVLEAVIFAAEAPPTLEQLSAALGLPEDVLGDDLEILCESYRSEERGVEIRPVGGGYRMFTKAEHRDAVKTFVNSLKPRLRLSRAALETLAIVAYRQPITIPEIGAIRGVSAPGGVIRTLLRHKLITTAGRKKVIGRPMRYKTTREFLIHFGLNNLTDLPTMKEMEDIGLAPLNEDLPVAAKATFRPGQGASGPDCPTGNPPDPGA